MTAFELLHPAIRQALYDQHWDELRPLQVEAIQVFSDSDADLVLSAATASGKTEAAFLPVLSQLVGAPAGSVGAIYIGPLKALINDQFGRLEELCRHAEIPVHRWHGDVSAAAKKDFGMTPAECCLLHRSHWSRTSSTTEPDSRIFGGSNTSSLMNCTRSSPMFVEPISAA